MKDREYIDVALEAVSDKYKWPHFSKWKRYHLSRLSDEIFKNSSIKLSLDTLRRLTGKKDINENYDPQPATKEAISILLGFDNWEAFKTRYVKPEIPSLQTQENLKDKAGLRDNIKKVIFGVIALILSISVYTIIKQTRINNNIYPFKELVFNKDESVVPNTISISFIKKLDYPDSLWAEFGSERFIKTEKVLLKGASGQINYCYQLPGYHQVKIQSASQGIVDSTLVFVPGRGWSSCIYVAGVQYFPINNDLENSWLTLNAEKVKRYFYPIDNIYSDFRYFKRMNIDGDEMIFKATVKSEALENMYSCQTTGFKLVGESGEILFDFNRNGCMALTSFKISDIQSFGSNTNLEELEQDFSKPTDLKVVVSKMNLQLYLNGKTKIIRNYKKPIGKLLGIVFVFQGVGSVKDISVSSLDSKKILPIR